MRERIEITDIFKASSFLCNGAEILTLKQIGNIITFELESEAISSLEKSYNRGRLLVNPVEFRVKLNMLRDLMFSKLREPKQEQTMWACCKTPQFLSNFKIQP